MDTWNSPSQNGFFYYPMRKGCFSFLFTGIEWKKVWKKTAFSAIIVEA
jgi:hypothetical protein